MKCVKILLLVSILLGREVCNRCFHCFSFSAIPTERGGFNDGHKPYQSQRNKTLKCTCGSVPFPYNIGGQILLSNFPWDVIITQSSSAPPQRLRNISKNNSDSDGNRTSSFFDVNQPCPGTIINNKIVLTSVKCILKLSRLELLDEPYKPLLFPKECVYSPQDLRVWTQVDLASSSNESNGSSPSANKGREISHIYYHPQYLSSKVYYGKVDYDVALLTLKESIIFGDDPASTVPVCLPDKPLKSEELVGHQVQITNPFGGWPSTSFIYPRMRCRVNSARRWISERFLCTLAPPFKESPFQGLQISQMKAGSAVTIRKDNIFTQYGLFSWMTYFPLLADRQSLSLSTNLAGFIEQIETYSAKMGAGWCMNDWNGLPSMRNWRFDETFVNKPVKQSKLPWKGMGQVYREVRKSCKCGRVNSKRSSSQGRIQGGTDAPAYEYGWIVQLVTKRGNRTSLCGASIINDRIVMTAAHCIFRGGSEDLKDAIQPQFVEVRVSRYKGLRSSDDNSFLAAVEKVIPHPEYSINLVKNDIALLVLSKPLNFKQLKGKVSPICFPEANETVSIDGRNDAIIIGWGRKDLFDKTSHANNLQELQVKTISNEDCLAILRKYKTTIFQWMISDGRRICAGNFRPVKQYKDPAFGDSGGPLVIPVKPGLNTMIQIGIASLVTAVSLMDDGLTDVLETVTIYTRTQSFTKFVDYYSLIAEATWCSR